ncbi:hypothetical protein NGM10_08870 [Halorussus salilacus]|uniref:CARDB domain-containing protein n=1 Tax=Halorussus salilacus TaxID=2953750 RepID=UPI00209FC5C8|nr:CARDB domain-containing protein [Halorussus salilacus]USZ66843.1 hypothetical protein NGM10_08870 [Halorussus salilacus]
MNRSICLLIAATIVLSGVSTGVFATSSSPDAYLGITEVTVSPDPPEPEEEFTVTAAVENLDNSSSFYDIDRVELRRGDEENFSVHDTTSPPGLIRSGEKRYVRVNGTIDDPGTHSLRLHVYGENEDGERIHVQHETEVRVGAERPQLEIDADEPVAKADSPVNVTLANGLPSDVRNVDVTLETEDASLENSHRTKSTVGSGEEANFEFTANANESGEHRFTATVRYTTENGSTKSITQHATPNFEPLSDQVSLNAESTGDGSQVTATVTNYGDVSVEDIVVRGRSANATLSDAPVDELDPGESETVDLNITEFDADGKIPVEVLADYNAGTTDARVNTSLDITSNPGSIELTGLETELEDGKVHLSGSASNVGLTEANSVIVRVKSADGVEPAHPNKEYFVGEVPESDFVSFDVYARVDDGVSEVPLEVTYLVDGERQTYTEAVEYRTDTVETATSDERDLLLPAAIGGGITLIAGGIMTIAWRNRRGGA